MPIPLQKSADDSSLTLKLRASDGRSTRDGGHRQLFTALYEELRRLARRKLRRDGSGGLGATTLLHEVYLKLHAREDVVFPDRAHFLAYASRMMRGLIIDFARSRLAAKRGSGFQITSLPTEVPEHAELSELQRVGEAVEQLAAVDPRLAQVVDLKFFSGFSFADIAALWEISERTVQRDWEKARLFLRRCLTSPQMER